MSRHSSFLEVKLPHIAHNVELIRRHYAPKAEIIAMVKGDAYGNGMVPVSTYLHAHANVRHFGVAALGEALALLQGCPAIAADPQVVVIVFSDTELLTESMRGAYAEQNAKVGAAKLWPVVGTLEQLELFCGERETTFAGVPLCLKVNTGMNRLGLTLEQLKEVTPRLLAPLASAGGVQLLLQHFSVSGMVGHPNTRSQYERFKQAREVLAAAGVAPHETSVANSGAIEQRLGVTETYVRPGLMLYGPSSLSAATVVAPESGVPKAAASPADGAPLRSWDGLHCGYLRSCVVHRYAAAVGDCIGYGYSSNILPAAAMIVLLPLGYADGFLRYYTGLPVTVAPGVTGEVFGNINMDLAAVAVFPHRVGKSVEELLALVTPGDAVLVWSDDLNAKAARVGTISYQMMTALTPRVRRVYTEEPIQAE